jgi:putative ABC transport system permease protein
MSIQTLSLALKLLYCEFRQGQLNLLILALVIATMSMSSIGFLIKGVEYSMSIHANQLNGAQLVLKSSINVPSIWLEKATYLSLKQAQMNVFSSMLVVNNQFKLAQIKAVSSNFPLQGELRMSAIGTLLDRQGQAPQPGSLWLDKRLLHAFSLSVKTSKHDIKIELGEAIFKVNGLLERVPGQSSA